ncbi:glycosyltransferase family 2 protein [Rhodococcus sp. 06-1460-1B]|uniref:glycosyltransferase family 2 protein n=1 Tax=Rhodococcus sp. 06-1460-1B TaxID=2022501 RepID=UPI000B9A68B9|nr:glycosyltransferase family 2 protein [Rhodococcus sp. 06-1460-1B]OZD63132.1 hypothetical protein CH268_09310 [Rhodococcus sp. 06-1460-1B]
MNGERCSKETLFTIVTVCFNDLQNLKSTCASVEAQNSPEVFEHVIIDGGSTDGSVEWLNGRDRDIRHRWQSQPDKGIFDAMNKGIQQSSGEYLCFLNAGDIFARPTVVQSAAHRMRGSGAIWGYGKARVVDELGTAVRPNVGMLPYSLRRHKYGRATVCHQAVWMSREYLMSVGGFDDVYGSAADYHRLLSAGRRQPPIVWADIDVDYRAGGVSDIDVYKQLWRRHRARTVGLNAPGLLAGLDTVFTVVQILNVRLRKSLKPYLLWLKSSISRIRRA